jgi:hypothetical protein
MSTHRLKLLVYKAKRDIQSTWVRCDKETGRECDGAQCSYPEHRVMVILDQMSDELKSK